MGLRSIGESLLKHGELPEDQRPSPWQWLGITEEQWQRYEAGEVDRNELKRWGLRD